MQIKRRIAFCSALWLLLALALPLPAGAQTYGDEQLDEFGNPKWEPRVPAEGFWPTPKMLDLFIARMSEQMADRYAFDEYQVMATQEVFRERLPRWLNENRPKIQTLTNEWVEMYMGSDPPDPQDVALWAQRVQPLLGEFREVIGNVATDMREYMTEDQLVTLDAELGVFNVGLNMTQGRIQGWADGGFNPEIDWHRSPGFREVEAQRREELEAAVSIARTEAYSRAGVKPPADVLPGGAGAAGSKSPGAAGEAASAQPGSAEPGAKPSAVDEWSAYVEGFIRKYDLNEAQRNSAYRILKMSRESRDKWLARNAPRMEKIEKLFASAKDPDALKKAEEEYRKLQEPIDNMFARMKERLEAIPTRAQRQAAQQNPPAPAANTPTAKPATAAGGDQPGRG